jgi:hypothetical protein
LPELAEAMLLVRRVAALSVAIERAESVFRVVLMVVS